MPLWVSPSEHTALPETTSTANLAMVLVEASTFVASRSIRCHANSAWPPLTNSSMASPPVRMLTDNSSMSRLSQQISMFMINLFRHGRELGSLVLFFLCFNGRSIFPRRDAIFARMGRGPSVVRAAISLARKPKPGGCGFLYSIKI